MKHQLKYLLNRFREDDQATMTVEFILILPVLMLWFIGSIVFFDAFDARAAAARTAHNIADIMSRQTDAIDDAYIDDLLLLQSRMLPREPAGELTVSALIRNATTGDMEVAWSYSTAGDPVVDADLAALTLPPMVLGETVLLVDSYVPFIPIADMVGIVAQTWTNRVVISPRYLSFLPNLDRPV